jgi:hypothetical protein
MPVLYGFSVAQRCPAATVNARTMAMARETVTARGRAEAIARVRER